MKSTSRVKVLDAIAYLEERQREASAKLSTLADPIERTKARESA